MNSFGKVLARVVTVTLCTNRGHESKWQATVRPVRLYENSFHYSSGWLLAMRAVCRFERAHIVMPTLAGIREFLSLSSFLSIVPSAAANGSDVANRNWTAMHTTHIVSPRDATFVYGSQVTYITVAVGEFATRDESVHEIASERVVLLSSRYD